MGKSKKGKGSEQKLSKDKSKPNVAKDRKTNETPSGIEKNVSEVTESESQPKQELSEVIDNLQKGVGIIELQEPIKTEQVITAETRVSLSRRQKKNKKMKLAETTKELEQGELHKSNDGKKEKSEHTSLKRQKKSESKDTRPKQNEDEQKRKENEAEQCNESSRKNSEKEHVKQSPSKEQKKAAVEIQLEDVKQESLVVESWENDDITFNQTMPNAGTVNSTEDADWGMYQTPDPYANQKYKKYDKFNKQSYNDHERRPFSNKKQSDGCRSNDWRSTNKSDDDKGFCQFMDMYKSKGFCQDSFIKVQEIQQDLFGMSTEYALAHCVAEDMNMGSGIAVQFSQQFKQRDQLYAQRQRQGGLAILEIKGRYIYYLVTKRQSTGKPTMMTMWSSLQKLQNHIQENKVKKLAIPRIGCGLDRLEWSEVKAMIEYTFKDTDIEITVCNFQQVEDDSGNDRVPQKRIKGFVKNEQYPITQIDGGTAILYFGTVNGFVSKEITDLDTKFRILMDYKNAKKQMGDIIHAYKNNEAYSLYGCIVKETEKHPFDFKQFQRCINQFKKKNKDDYYYVAFQAFLDVHDDLLMIKIVNMLRYSLFKNDIYVCWGGDMIQFMPQLNSY